jgi:hypothetical protein
VNAYLLIVVKLSGLFDVAGGLGQDDYSSHAERLFNRFFSCASDRNFPLPASTLANRFCRISPCQSGEATSFGVVESERQSNSMAWSRSVKLIRLISAVSIMAAKI